jgi:hypothetical protein
MVVEFPPETELIPTTKSGHDLICLGLNGFPKHGLQCQRDPNSKNTLIIRLKGEPEYATGLYRVSVAKVRNPPSTKRTVEFVQIYHTTAAK